MRTSVPILVLTAILLQSASGHAEKKYNEGRIKLYKLQSRLDNGEARFTSAILNKLGLKGQIQTTTSKPTTTSSTSTLDPTITSGTSGIGPTGTTTSATSAIDTGPNTITSGTSGTRPGLTTSGTSTDDGYSPSSSSPSSGPEVETTNPIVKPVEPDTKIPLPTGTFPGGAVTSRAVYDDDSLNGEDEDEVEKTENAFEINNDDQDDNHIAFYDDLKEDLNKFNSNVHLGRSSRPTNLRRNRIQQTRRRRQQQQLSHARRNRATNARRNRRQRRRPLSRRRATNLRGRRRRAHRRRLLRRRNNARREAQRRQILRRHRRKNGYRINSNKRLRRNRRRPIQKIVIREV